MIYRLLKKMIQSGTAEHRVGVILLFALGLSVVFGTAFYFAERDAQAGLTWLDSIWWAMVTMTTVGYGDFFATTFAGRFLVSYPAFIIGIGLLAYFLGVIADAIILHASRARRGLLPVMKQDHVVICGYPSPEKIIQIVNELRAVDEFADCPVALVTDRIDELPTELQRRELQFVQGSPLREEVLRKAGVCEARGVFILANDPSDHDNDARTFAISALITGLEKECGRDIRVVCELLSKQHRSMMLRAGTDGILVHEGLTDSLLVQEFLYPGVNDIFHQISTNTTGSRLFIVPTTLSGTRFSDLQHAVIDHAASLQAIGLVRDGNFILNPSRNHAIADGDRVVIIAESVEAFREIEEDIRRRPISPQPSAAS